MNFIVLYPKLNLYAIIICVECFWLILVIRRMWSISYQIELNSISLNHIVYNSRNLVQSISIVLVNLEYGDVSYFLIFVATIDNNNVEWKYKSLKFIGRPEITFYNYSNSKTQKPY